MSIAIISGSDAGFFPFMKGLIGSLLGHPQHEAAFLGVLDGGLDPAQRAWLDGKGIARAEIGWDIPIPAGRDRQRLIQTDYARPFLADYFPGHEIYIWLDADAWVQEWSAIDLLIEGARRSGCAIVPEVHRAYRNFCQGLDIDRILGLPVRVTAPQYKRYKRAYNRADAERYGTWPVLNNGVNAIHAEAPHWARWRHHFAAGVQRTDNRIDQVSLNYAIYHESLSVEFLPAWCNWLCHMARPAYDAARDLYVEPTLPHQPIGILHLAADSKRELQDVPLVGGGRERRDLRFAGGADRP